MFFPPGRSKLTAVWRGFGHFGLTFQSRYTFWRSRPALASTVKSSSRCGFGAFDVVQCTGQHNLNIVQGDMLSYARGSASSKTGHLPLPGTSDVGSKAFENGALLYQAGSSALRLAGRSSNLGESQPDTPKTVFSIGWLLTQTCQQIYMYVYLYVIAYICVCFLIYTQRKFPSALCVGTYTIIRIMHRHVERASGLPGIAKMP